MDWHTDRRRAQESDGERERCWISVSFCMCMWKQGWSLPQECSSELFVLEQTLVIKGAGTCFHEYVLCKTAVGDLWFWPDYSCVCEFETDMKSCHQPHRSQKKMHGLSGWFQRVCVCVCVCVCVKQQSHSTEKDTGWKLPNYAKQEII